MRRVGFFAKTGSFNFVGQCCFEDDGLEKWSLIDFFISMISFLRLVQQMWNQVSYFGESAFNVTLCVEKLSVQTKERYRPKHYRLNAAWPLEIAVLNDRPSRVGGSAEAFLRFDDRGSRRVESLANIGNRVLRDLGFDVEIAKLQAALDALDSFW